MSDSFTEVTSQSWLSRLGDSIKSVLFGVVLFLVAFPLLWWNEGRAVRTAKALRELGGSVVSISPEKIDRANDGEPVHLSGEATTNAKLSDPVFGVEVPAIALRRSVEMYQWDEEKHTKKEKKVGGSEQTRTTYSYRKTWSSQAIDSSQFHAQGRTSHENPGPMRFQSEKFTAGDVRVGAFKLPPPLVEQIDNFESLQLTGDDLTQLEKLHGDRAVFQEHQVYLPYSANGPKPDPAQPKIGDLRVAFSVARPTTVSLVAEQAGDTFTKWQSKAARGMGTSVERLEVGNLSAEEMVGKMESENTMLTWGLRLLGFVLMAVGIGLVFKPLAVLADVLPLLGDLLRMGIGLFAGVIAAGLSLVTIALAWLFYRPLLGTGLIVVAGVLVGGAIKLARGRSGGSASADQPPPPPPPPTDAPPPPPPTA